MKKNHIVYKVSLIVIAFYWSSCSLLSPDITNNDTEQPSSEWILADTLQQGDTIKVVTWNIKFGAGKANYYTDCHDKNVHFQSRDIRTNVKSIVQALESINPDIVLLQEVDFNSKRSAYLNELQYLLNETNLNYAYYVPEWKENFVPVDGLGYINAGNAILTKAPIQGVDFFPLPNNKPTDKTTSIYYFEPNITEVELIIGKNKRLFVLNSRFSEFEDHEFKKSQVLRIQDRAKELIGLGHVVIVGGCFYSLPPNTSNTTDFEDEICTDDKWNSVKYATENSPVQSLYGILTPAVSQSNYGSSNAPYFTHSRSSTEPWNRKTDYLFVSKNVTVLKNITHQLAIDGLSVKDLSDHCPIEIHFQIP